MAIQETVLQIGATRLTGYSLPATAAQASTNALAAIADSVVDVAPFDYGSMTVSVATKGITAEVHGANLSDFSDEVKLAEGVIAAGASLALLPNITGILSTRYLRVKIKSTVAGQHGTAIVRGVFKRTR